MIKYSVKRPYTVFVGVILALVLGFVSFLGLKTDLLPTIELPMAIVMTTYPGATPEKVELEVTNLIEDAVATVSDLENITSTSSENVSIVILEFNESVNMDSAMIEVNNQVNAVEGNFDDLVMAPTIIKINPNLLPIQMLSVDVEGMDVKELTTFVEEEILFEFERLGGVATVNVSGSVEDYLEISLNQTKIDEINDDILHAIDSDLYEVKSELVDAQNELNTAKEELETTKNEVYSNLSEVSLLLDSTNAQLQSYISEQTAAQVEVEIAKGAKDLFELKLLVDNTIILINTLPDDTVIVEQLMADPSLSPILGILLEAKMITLDMSVATMRLALPTMSTEFKTQLIGLGVSEDDIDNGDITNTKNRYNEANNALNSANTLVNSTKEAADKIASEYKTLEKSMLEVSEEFAVGSIQIDSGINELESAIDNFEDQREQALKSANIDSLVTQEAISGILTAQNFNLPAGSIKDLEGNTITVKVGDVFDSIEELENLLLLDMGIDGVDPIYLKDVAEVSIKDNSLDSTTKINGNPGIFIDIQKSSTASTTEVSALINAKVVELMETHDGLNITTLMDQGIYINLIIDSVLQNLLYGGVIAFILLLVFLKDVKPTLVIAMSIPLSLLISIVLMYFSNVTLNIISLSGLALGVGMLVDNSIVVIENIYRLRNEGMDKYNAAVKGATQVAGAIFASTLTTVCVFLPIVFVEGMTQELFIDMGLTIAYSLFASLLVALTLVPAMASTVLTSTNEKENKLFNRMVNSYEKLLKLNLKYKFIVIIMSLVLLVVSIYNAFLMPLEMFPQMDSNQMQMTYTDKELNKEEIMNNANIIAENIMEIEGVTTVGYSMGSSISLSPDNNTLNYNIIIDLESGRASDEIAQEILSINSEYSEYLTVSASTMDMSALTGSGITISIKGNDLDELKSISDEIKALVINVEGVSEVVDGYEDSIEELRIDINKNIASEYGLMVAQVYQEVSASIKEETPSTSFVFNGESYNSIIVNDTSVLKDDIENIVVAEDEDGNDVILSDIATIYNSEVSSSISHDSQSRVVTVTISIADGYNASLVGRDIDLALENFEAPSGYLVEREGEDVTITETINDLLLMVALAVTFIYLIMVAQFQNLMSPFIILFTIPLAFTGGLLALQITNMPLAITAMVGFLVLAGVVVNNGIVFVDYINNLRLDGMDKRAAIIKAGKDRMRPIIMTALTTILAMSTMALGIGQGSEMSQGMAIVTIGGLTYSTILTLFLVPVLYDLFYRKEIKNIDV